MIGSIYFYPDNFLLNRILPSFLLLLKFEPFNCRNMKKPY